MSSLERLGWGPFFEQQVHGNELLHDKVFARVVEEQRGAYRVSGDYEGLVEVSGRFRHVAAAARDYPAIGDWVALERGSPIIQHRFERRSAISRAAAGRAVAEQVIAANVDTVFIVTAADEDLNVRRLERYLTMIWESGATPVVLVNKIDLTRDAGALLVPVRARLPFVDVVGVSALDGEHLDALGAHLLPQRTVALVGSSGVGKSTLVNRLAGEDRQRIAPIRASDGRGRHTTTARQLIELPGGALLIDTPGMRELQPWVNDSVVDAAFDDVAEIARACRYADCRHETEPGCAVREAVETGTLDADRLENYRHLAREAAFEERKRDKAAAANHKRRWKQAMRAQRALYRERERLK